MISIAIIRVAFAKLPNQITDTVWLIFWQGIESSVAIITVSLVAFRSLLGPNGSKPFKASPLIARNIQASGSPCRKVDTDGIVTSSIDMEDRSFDHAEVDMTEHDACHSVPMELPTFLVSSYAGRQGSNDGGYYDNTD